MQRVTLLVDRIDESETARRIYLTGSNGCLYIHARHVLSVEDADGRDFAPPAPPAAGDILTSAELDALPVGAVVDATVTGVRVRAMRLEAGGWSLTERLDNSPFAATLSLEGAVLVTDGPIQPAPIKPLPLPTEPGARFWGRVYDSEPQWWFVREPEPGDQWYVPSVGFSLSAQDASALGLVRLPDPGASDVTA